MELYQGIRYLILTGMIMYLAYQAWQGVVKVKNKVTG